MIVKLAKKSTSVLFKNSTINLKDMTITEYIKDDSTTYNIMDVLKDWDGIDGVSLSLKQDDELVSTYNGNGEDEG
jgi:hypothetical protein